MRMRRMKYEVISKSSQVEGGRVLGEIHRPPPFFFYFLSFFNLSNSLSSFFSSFLAPLKPADPFRGYRSATHANPSPVFTIPTYTHTLPECIRCLISGLGSHGLTSPSQRSSSRHVSCHFRVFLVGIMGGPLQGTVGSRVGSTKELAVDKTSRGRLKGHGSFKLRTTEVLVFQWAESPVLR